MKYADILMRYYGGDLVPRRALDIAAPARITKKTALFYIHGGGWAAGSRDQYHRHLLHFAAHGHLTASAGYRLAPEVSLSEQMGDVVAGYDAFRSFIKERRADIRSTVVVGSSAGAHLASLLALTEPGRFANVKLRNRWVRPAACVSVCGPATLELIPGMNPEIKRSIENVLRAKYGKGSPVFREASPDAHVDGRAPDFLFLLAEKEEYFPHRYVEAMAAKLRSFGKRAEVAVFPAEHGFFYRLDNAAQKSALRRMKRFLASIERGR